MSNAELSDNQRADIADLRAERDQLRRLNAALERDGLAVVAERDDGSIAAIDRWYVDSRGRLVHHPYGDVRAHQADYARRGHAAMSATRPDKTLEMATRRAQ